MLSNKLAGQVIFEINNFHNSILPQNFLVVTNALYIYYADPSSDNDSYFDKNPIRLGIKNLSTIY